MEILRAAEVLSEKFRAENPAVLALDEASIGLAREEELSGAEDDQRKGDRTAATAKTSVAEWKREASLRKVFMVFLTKRGEGATTTRSISLMPMNGTMMTPPTP